MARIKTNCPEAYFRRYLNDIKRGKAMYDYISLYGESKRLSKELKEDIQAHNLDVKLMACTHMVKNKRSLRHAARFYKIPNTTLWRFVHSSELRVMNYDLYETVMLYLRCSPHHNHYL